jgi:hypothetical protein
MEVLCDPDRKYQNQMDKSVLFYIAAVNCWGTFVERYSQGKRTVGKLEEKSVSVKVKWCRAGTLSQSNFKKHRFS